MKAQYILPFLLPALLFLAGQGAIMGTRPEMYFNLYRNSPRVRLLKAEIRRLDLEEGDRQHTVLSEFSGGYTLHGSTFFLPGKTSTSMMPVEGIITNLFPSIPKVLRVWAAFRKRGLNYVEFRFNPHLKIPDWAESLEFWSLEFIRGRKYRLAYLDEAGREYWLNFKQKQEAGWQRYSGNLEIRSAPGRSFSYRYQKLRVSRLLLLDDFAKGPRRNLYHLTALGASRIRRTWGNRQEFWQYREILRFDGKLLPRLKYLFMGTTGGQLVPESETSSLFQGSLRIHGKLKGQGEARIHIKIKKKIRVAVCRTIRLAVHGGGRLEHLYMLISDRLGRYYLVDFGVLNFSGWKKLEAVLPVWIDQEDYQQSGKRGIRIHELLIIPSGQRGIRDVDLRLGPLGAVYDRGIRPVANPFLMK